MSRNFSLTQTDEGLKRVNERGRSKGEKMRKRTE